MVFNFIGSAGVLAPSNLRADLQTMGHINLQFEAGCLADWPATGPRQ